MFIQGTTGDDPNLKGTNQADEIHALAGDDHVFAKGGNDLVLGGLDDDHLYGDGGKDELRADGGNDHLYGEGAADDLYSGQGSDRFVYNQIGHVQGDVIKDYNDASDFIDLSGIDAVKGGADDAFTLDAAGAVGEAGLFSSVILAGHGQGDGRG